MVELTFADGHKETYVVGVNVSLDRFINAFKYFGAVKYELI